jgi:tetratricopeptide (TPR) repeat protein
MLSVSQKGDVASPPAIPKPRGIDALARKYYQLGRDLYLAEEFDGAISYLRRAVNRTPKWGEAQLYLGLSLYQVAELTEAKAASEFALDDSQLSNSDRAMAHDIIGSTYYFERKYKEAEDNYRSAIKEDPGYVWPANNLAYLFAVMGTNLEEALKLVEPVFLRDLASYGEFGEAVLLDTRGWIYYRMDKYQQAEADLTRAVEKFDEGKSWSRMQKKSWSEMHYHVGELYRVNKKDSLAREQFLRAIQLDEGNEMARIGLQKANEN